MHHEPSHCNVPRLPAGEPQGFADLSTLGRCGGVTQRIHAGAKLPRPVLEPRRPWESHRVYAYGTVLRDQETGRFRMWYMASGAELSAPRRDPRLDHRPQDLVLYAESVDGLAWERPDLGLYSFDGSTRNNIVWDYHSPSVVVDPAPAGARARYTMLGVQRVEGRSAYAVAHSPDGLTWQAYPRNPVLEGGDTCTLTRDQENGRFLAFHKRYESSRGHRRRLVYLSSSHDLRRWSEPELAMAPDEIDDEQTRREGGQCSQFYNMAAFRYTGCWLGMVTHFRYSGKRPVRSPGQSHDDGPIDVQLAVSADGRTWRRLEDRSPVIANGPYGYDAGCILGVTNRPCIVGDEVWLYYTAVTTTHGGALPEKAITVAMARWRAEGFVSLDAGAQEGVVETGTFTTSGGRLYANAEAADGGVAVEVTDADGAPIPGYGREDARPIRGDATRQAAVWRERRTIPAGRPVRLRFHLRQARLYSFVIA